MWKDDSISPQLTEADDEEEEKEEVLDEEAQLMASMGLPLAFASSSAQRRVVSYEIKINWNVWGSSCRWMSLFLVMWQGRRSNRKPATYKTEPDEDEEDERDLQVDNKGNTINVLLLLFTNMYRTGYWGQAEGLIQ